MVNTTDRKWRGICGGSGACRRAGQCPTSIRCSSSDDSSLRRTHWCFLGRKTKKATYRPASSCRLPLLPLLHSRPAAKSRDEHCALRPFTRMLMRQTVIRWKRRVGGRMRIGKQFRSLYRLFSSVRVISLDIHSTDIYIYLCFGSSEKVFNTQSDRTQGSSRCPSVSDCQLLHMCSFNDNSPTRSMETNLSCTFLLHLNLETILPALTYELEEQYQVCNLARVRQMRWNLLIIPACFWITYICVCVYIYYMEYLGGLLAIKDHDKSYP